MSWKQTICNHKPVVESFFSLSVLNGLAVLFPLITMPYILRVVGPEKYGVYGFIYILVQYVLILNNYGFDFSVTRQISQHREDKAYVNRVFNAVIACRLLLLAAGAALFFALSPVLMRTSTQRLMFLGGLTLVLGNTFIPVWLFQGMEKMRYLTIVNVVGKSFFLVLVFVIIRRPEHYVFLPLLDGLGYVAAGILSMVFARRQFGIKWGLPSGADIKRQFKDGAAIFASTLGMTFYRKSNIFILRFFVGDAALGVYTAAEKIIVGLQSLISPVSQALFPHLGRSFAGRTEKENLQSLRKVSNYMFLLLLAASLCVVIFSKPLVRILCGSEFTDARPLLIILSPVILFGGMNYILGIVGLVNLNRSKSFLTGVLAAGLTSITWLLCTATALGATAGAWAMTLAETVLFAACLISLCIRPRSERMQPKRIVPKN